MNVRIRQWAIPAILLCVIAVQGFYSSRQARAIPAPDTKELELGNFSVSLKVKDLKASREFYQKLGFRVFMGKDTGKMMILQNETSTIGLFLAGIEKNTLTFNPGWNRQGQPLESFDDIRSIQKHLIDQGITPVVKADESSTGPAFVVLVDPDGNPVFLDQHVPKP